MKIQTHLYLISAQATPNLTPALDKTLTPKRIIFLVSPDMQKNAQWLEQTLKPRGIKITYWEIAHAFDIEYLQHRIMELLEAETDQSKSIALNATGGTKPMSIAAYEVFRAYDLPIFYIHPEHDRLIWLHPREQPAIELADRIRLEAFLQAHGAQVQSIERNPVASKPHEATRKIIQGIHHYTKALGTINWLASTARNSLVSKPLDQKQRGQKELTELINLFTETGLIHLVGHRIHFHDEESRFYVNGGWIEGYVFSLITKMRSRHPEIQDVARSINVLRSTTRGEVPNEIDIALLVNNRLCIIECKTRKWQGASTGANAIYRLETLKDLLGGLQAKAMLISYVDLPKYDKQRADDLNIQICAGTGILNLRSQLEKWIG
ncbi:MAG TPA: DUF1887 family protein [Gammaproteobacteria bacterium]|nr:DUF1887 family protein [Gammaproteobacteria bacterium]